jgi:hypothetical protein
MGEVAAEVLAVFGAAGSQATGGRWSAIGAVVRPVGSVGHFFPLPPGFLSAGLHPASSSHTSNP